MKKFIDIYGEEREIFGERETYQVFVHEYRLVKDTFHLYVV